MANWDIAVDKTVPFNPDDLAYGNEAASANDDAGDAALAKKPADGLFMPVPPGCEFLRHHVIIAD